MENGPEVVIQRVCDVLSIFAVKIVLSEYSTICLCNEKVLEIKRTGNSVLNILVFTVSEIIVKDMKYSLLLACRSIFRNALLVGGASQETVFIL